MKKERTASLQVLAVRVEDKPHASVDSKIKTRRDQSRSNRDGHSVIHG